MATWTFGQTTKVWDAFIRFFHWSLVLAFTAAYLTFQFGMQETHAILGYFITTLVALRFVWGFIGSTHARFNDFIYPPKTVLRYLRAILKGHPQRYLGHNPAGGVMVLAMLVTLIVITVSGLVILATIEFDGPLLGSLHNVTDNTAYTFREVHEVFVNVALGLIALHIVGVISASIQHRESLVKAMITGRKQVSDLGSNT